jgi:type IV secretory pathway VirB4 component
MTPGIRWQRGGRSAPPAPQLPGSAGSVDLLGPHALQVHSGHLGLGDGVCRTLAITGFPREVGPGWLQPLLEHPGRFDVALHVEPVPTAVATDRLRRQLARLESTRRADLAKGRLVDPQLDAAAGDAHDLAGRLARGQGKLFRLGLYLTVHAADRQTLDDDFARLKALAGSLLLDPVPATFRALAGWVTTLPLGVDRLGLRRTMDTAALAAAFPFTTTGLSTRPQPRADSDPTAGGELGGDAGADAGAGGVLYGVSATGSQLVYWDRFAQDNYNSVILARSGAGKSYLAKLEALRSLYTGVDVAVIDPEDEYARLAAAVGGTYLKLGSPGVRLNPFDLPPGPDALTRRCLFLHTFIAVLLGAAPDPAAAAALDRALLATYHQVGISADPRTHTRPAPLLADLARTLSAGDDPGLGGNDNTAGRQLALRLAPYVTGSHRGLFDGPTSTRPDGHLVVFCLRELPDELKTVGTLLTLDAVWRRVSDPAVRRRRLVVVDEAWLLMRDPAGARFLFRMAKSARKHWCALAVVTQDAGDLLGSELGQAVVANAATQVLLRQAPQTIDALAGAFALSDGEKAFLLTAARGEGLLAAGTDRIAFRALASPAEHALVTTNPAELAAAEPDL